MRTFIRNLMKFANLKKKVNPPAEAKLDLNTEECLTFLSLIAESEIKVKDIQRIYDLIYKIQDFIQNNKQN